MSGDFAYDNEYITNQSRFSARRRLRPRSVALPALTSIRLAGAHRCPAEDGKHGREGPDPTTVPAKKACHDTHNSPFMGLAHEGSVREDKKARSKMTTLPSTLTWDVYVAPSEPTVTDDLPPSATQRLWSPTSATLISGEQDAVLVDALLTVGQARDLADWVAAHGKNLTAVYITHGHGDHWFGLSVILDRFPN